MALLAAYNDYHFSLAGTNAARTGGHTNNGLTKSAAGGMPVLPVGLTAASQSANRTVMVWARGTGGIWYIRWQVDSINSGAWGILHVSPNIAVQARNASGFVRPGAPIPGDGGWHHYAGTYDGTTARFFLDGVEVASAVLSPPMRTDADRIDLMEWSDANTSIDDLRIYDAALLEAEIATLMATPVTAPAADPVPTPAERVHKVAAESRATGVAVEIRAAAVPAESRINIVEG